MIFILIVSIYRRVINCPLYLLKTMEDNTSIVGGKNESTKH